MEGEDRRVGLGVRRSRRCSVDGILEGQLLCRIPNDESELSVFGVADGGDSEE